MKRLIFMVVVVLLAGCSKDPDYADSKGTFKDTRDNKAYDWVRIGEQIWMAENLAWLPEVSPPDISSTTAPRYYVYGYEGTDVTRARRNSNFDKYGALYNWAAASTSCPPGWHLPDNSEWQKLEMTLGMDATEVMLQGWRISGDVGEKLKSRSGWNDDGNGDNSSGFNALPGGGRGSGGTFDGMGDYSPFWTASEISTSYAVIHALTASEQSVLKAEGNRTGAFMVRCVRNE